MRTARDLLYLGGYALEPRVARRYYGGGDPPPATSTTTVQQQYSPEDAAARKKVTDAADNIYNSQQGIWNSVINPAAKPVGASENTLQAQQMVKDAAVGSGTTLAGNATAANNFGLSSAVLDPNNAPGFSGALDAVTRRVDHAYTDPGGVLSQIRSGFTAGSSGGSGTREGIAGGIAGREYLNTIGDVTSKMSLDQYGKGLDFMKSSMALAPSTYNLGVQPGLTVGAVGTQEEAYAQQQENALAGDRSWQLTAPWAGLQPYANIVQGFSNPSTVTTGSAPVSAGGGGAMGLLGGAMMGAQMGAQFGMPLAGAGAGALLSLFR